MKIAIRDDDTSFFTNPNELKKAHEFLRDFPISFRQWTAYHGR